MIETATPLLVALGVVTGWLALRDLWRSSADPAVTRVLVVVLVGLSVASETRFVPRSPALQLIVALTMLLLVALVALGPAAWRRERDRRRLGGLLLVVAAWATMFASDVWNNYDLGSAGLLGRLAPAVLWLGLLGLWLLGGVARDSIAPIIALVLAAATISVAFIPSAFAPCNQFKCGFLGALLRGPFYSENYFAILAVLTLTLAVGGSLRSGTWPAATLAVAVLIATGGRTSQIAAVVAIIAMMAAKRAAQDREVASRVAGLAAVLVPLVFGSVGVWLTYNAATDSLSNRGTTWARAHEVLAGHEIFGRGLSRWEGYGNFEPVSQHFPHSVYLLALFSGGYVALALLLAAIGRAIAASGSRPEDFRAVLGYATAVLTLGLAGITVNLMSIDGLWWLLLPLFARQGAQSSGAVGEVVVQRRVGRPVPTGRAPVGPTSRGVPR